MKFCWRITKYDPKYRGPKGVYLNDEWCIYSEVGKLFNNAQFTFDEYVRVENLYIEAIKLFMECHDISALQVNSLERNKKLEKDVHNNSNMITLFNGVQESDWIKEVDIKDFCSLILRDKIWCKLRYKRKMVVHFGWDFYMYIGSVSSCEEVIAEIEKSGLFVEVFKSPYE
jgi:hypothetical protein